MLLKKYILTVMISVAVLSAPANADTMLAVISPHQTEKHVKEDIQLLMSWLIKLPKGDSVIILNGWNGNRLATLTRPVEDKYQNPKAMMYRNVQGLGKLNTFAKARPKTPVQATGTLHIPLLMKVISQNYPQVNDITLIGSAQDMHDAQSYLTDSNLTKSSLDTEYGVSDVSERLKGKRIHWLLKTELTPFHYAQKVERFFHLYLHKQHGELVTFSADKALVTDRLFNKATPLPMPYKLSRAPSTKPMDSLFTRAPSEGGAVRAHLPQTIRIGIAWQGKVDLDIYGLIKGEAKPVYYANTKTRYATHHKDIRTGSHQQVTTYETITYHTPINLCDLRIGVNYYGGASPRVHGTLRIKLGDQLMAKDFRFSARGGNKGQDIKKVLQDGRESPHSQRFLLRDVVGIKGCA